MRIDENFRDEWRAALWRDRFAEHVFDILPTASADPELSSRVPGGPVTATYQLHRTVFYPDPDLDYPASR